MTYMMTAPSWLPVPSCPVYEVSNRGIVRRDGRSLKPSPVGGGYLQVTLSVAGHRRCRYVCALVLEAFVGACPPGQEARHLNGDRADNSLGNLRWGTPLENLWDARVHGRWKPALDEATREAIRKARVAGESIASVAMRLGVSAKAVRRWGGPTCRKQLQPETVDLIRLELEAGRGLRAIARAHGVSPPTVANIRDGVTWRQS